jgi:hypothetical protein
MVEVKALTPRLLKRARSQSKSPISRAGKWGIRRFPVVDIRFGDAA